VGPAIDAETQIMFSVALSNSAPRLAFPKLTPIFHFGIQTFTAIRPRDPRDAPTRTVLHRRLLVAMSSTPPTEASTTSDSSEVTPVQRTLVVAVDETEDSVKALKWTIENFYKPDDILHLLHVIPYVHQQVLTSTVYYTPPILDPEISEQLYLNAEEVVNEKFVPVLKASNVKYSVDMVKEKGSETIGDAVCHAAADLNACAVVVASHKKHWLQTWLMGSSSREIAGKAPIPVVVYHG